MSEVQKTEPTDQIEKEEDANNKGLSKGQLKKLKEKKKKEEEARKKAQEEVKGETKVEENQEKQVEVKEKKDDKKKKGKTANNPAAQLARKKMEEQANFRAEQQRKRIQYEQQQERLRLFQQEQKRLAQQEHKRKIQQAKAQIKRQKKAGTYVKQKDKQKLQKQRVQLQAMQKQQQKQQNQQDEPSEDEVRQMLQQKKKKEESKLLKDYKQYFDRKGGEFRSPVCCILGHVDTGKTTLLDKIRRTNVQEGEAGGITQQIGATLFPGQKLNQQITKCQGHYPVKLDVPGLLIIDTPGHQSFSNLRSRGSSLCDIAILVIDLQHGLENQTLQSMQLLAKGKIPFVVALNKIDRSYGWKAKNDASSYLTLKQQAPQAFQDYQTKLQKIILQLNTKGYNAALYWQNPDPQDYISLVPTSGVTGQGIPDLLSCIVNYSQTMPSIKKKITIKQNHFRCTVMQVKMLQGYGTTIDVMLVDGCLKKDDQFVILGFQGPILTKVKALLTPHPMKESRVNNQYLHHKQVWGANGVKVAANGLDKAVAGTPLLLVHNQDQIQDAKAIVQNQYENVKKKIKLQPTGVGVAASTLGSLQALLQYLQKSQVPVSYVTVGPVSKQDVMKAMKSVLSQVPDKRKKQYACILAFDIKILADAQKYADQNQIKIFTANIIYHLTDFFTKYVEDVKKDRADREGKQAVFPCVLKQVHTFRKSDPIVLGVDVEAGVLKIGTPIVVFRQKERGDKQVRLGFIQSIQHNHKKIKQARKLTGSVAISIGGDASISAGKQFQPTDRLVSLLTRRSIDCLKEHFRNQVQKDEWQLIIDLKKYFNI